MTPSTMLLVLSTLVAAAAPQDHSTRTSGGPTLRPLWERQLGVARGASLRTCRAVGPRVLVVDAAGGVTALDPASGAIQWFVQAPGPVTAFLPSDGGAIATASGTDVLAIDGATGRRVFQVQSASAPAYSPCSDGRLLYVPALLGDMLVAWDMSTGTRAWECHMPAHFAGPATVTGSQGTGSVLVPTADGLLRAVPAQLGVPERERWTQRVGTILGAPLVVGQLILVASSDRAVIALDAPSGVVKWKHFTGAPVRSPPVVVGERVVVRTSESLVALDLATGASAWEQPESALPLGEVGGELLVRAPRGGCEWREIATGRLITGGLPAGSIAASGMLVELSSGAIAGWKRSEH
ncbi:MAG TPA: PQQ-binding-like beta-propeller repeat protein [Planctomycetota bacterium]|nr:PQQ-binding-like beta-propeller repeat protein [Planctomycetota bacterium]